MEKQVYLPKKNVRKKRVKEEGRSYFCSPQKYECHSHIAHSSFAPYFVSGAQEWCSKECRFLTHWLQVSLNKSKVIYDKSLMNENAGYAPF